MQNLVEMKLASSVRSKSPEDGIALIERYIFPTLEICKKLQGGEKSWEDRRAPRFTSF